MRLLNKMAQHKEYFSGVKHCTFNPNGPGVVRIHLIPPKFRIFGNPNYIVILNGYYLLPLGYSWAVMLSAFMKETAEFDGKEINAVDYNGILDRAVKATVRSYPFITKEEIREDLLSMLDIIFAIARGENPDVDIDRMSIRSYADNMYAPHRMDLMVSAMTDDLGRWKCNQKCIFC